MGVERGYENRETMKLGDRLDGPHRAENHVDQTAIHCCKGKLMGLALHFRIC
jgi:hypothetical protein